MRVLPTPDAHELALDVAGPCETRPGTGPTRMHGPAQPPDLPPEGNLPVDAERDDVKNLLADVDADHRWCWCGGFRFRLHCSPPASQTLACERLAFLGKQPVHPISRSSPPRDIGRPRPWVRQATKGLGSPLAGSPDWSCGLVEAFGTRYRRGHLRIDARPSA